LRLRLFATFLAGKTMRTLRTLLFACLCTPAFALGVANVGASTERAMAPADAEIQRAIRHYRVTTLRLQHVIGGPVVRTAPVPNASLERVQKVWRRRAKIVKGHFSAGPPHRSAWRCIHRYEGSWTDGGGPYYGGLQMDIGFQQRYGHALLRTKGTADNWTPLEQMWVAERAYRSGRGFYPWPNTARYCGLI
jgi:hypothetical protein